MLVVLAGFGESLQAQRSSRSAARELQALRDSLAQADAIAQAKTRLLDSIRAAADSALVIDTAVLHDTVPIVVEIEPTDDLSEIRGSDSLRRLGVPVVFRGDTLFRVYTKAGVFSPRQRARLVAEQIAELASLPRNQFDSILVVAAEGGTYNVVYGDRIINSVSALDAAILDTTAVALATRNRALIRASLIRAYEDQTISSRLKDLGMFAGLLVLLVLLWAVINKVFNYQQLVLQQRLKRYMSRKLLGGNSQLMKLINPRAQLNVLLLAIRMLRLLSILLLLYLFLPFLFSQLSYTRGFGERLLTYVVTPLIFVRDSIVAYLPNLFFVLVIGWLSYQLMRFIGWLAGRVQSGEVSVEGFYSDWAQPTANLVRVLVVVLTVIVIFPLLPGSGSPAFQGISVFIGLLLSLGGASAVGNVVSGIILTYMRPFQIGHRVKIGDNVGDVVAKTLLVTRIRTTKNEEITVPNGNLLSGGLINYTALAESHGLVLHTSITIGYDVPWTQVHDLMLTAAAKTPSVEATPAPFILQKSLRDWYVEYELNVYTRDSHAMPRTYSALHANLQDAFRDAGVEIMSPHYMALRKGDETTIPSG